MPALLPHHAQTIERTMAYFSVDPAVEALILVGSLAHGLGTPSSDVDVMIVISDADCERRVSTGQTCFFSRELCVYPDGYVDGKYISSSLIEQVAARGSEPSRFAFKDARILFSRNPSLPELLVRAAQYPTENKASRLWRFQAQFEAWTWYTSEALKKQNLPLLRLAAAKLTLFGGRIILAHNHLLYPYHKWFLRVLATAPEKPAGVMELIQTLAESPTIADIDAFGQAIRSFKSWNISHATWPAQFMADSELNWLKQEPPIDDL